MNAKDIRAMSPAELQEELVELRREQFNLRMQRATGQTSAWARFRQVRRDIARIKTIMTEKERVAS